MRLDGNVCLGVNDEDKCSFGMGGTFACLECGGQAWCGGCDGWCQLVAWLSSKSCNFPSIFVLLNRPGSFLFLGTVTRGGWHQLLLLCRIAKLEEGAQLNKET